MPSTTPAPSRIETFKKLAGASLTRLIAVVEYRAALELDSVETGSLLRLAEHRHVKRCQQLRRAQPIGQ